MPKSVDKLHLCCNMGLTLTEGQPSQPGEQPTEFEMTFTFTAHVSIGGKEYTGTVIMPPGKDVPDAMKACDQEVKRLMRKHREAENPKPGKHRAKWKAVDEFGDLIEEGTGTLTINPYPVPDPKDCAVVDGEV